MFKPRTRPDKRGSDDPGGDLAGVESRKIMNKMSEESSEKIEIKKLQDTAEAEICARMMADSEPWITLRRNYDTSLRILTDPAREVYLATINGQMAGFTILIMHGALVGYIQSVCVAPEWRNKGIGSQLMVFAEERIFSENPNAFICVSSFNKGGRRLYKRLGYEVVGKLKDYIVPGHSEFLLRKTTGPLTEFKKG
jgi:ribosomal protein S18 acetylase RimI-like enzyme